MLQILEMRLLLMICNYLFILILLRTMKRHPN